MNATDRAHAAEVATLKQALADKKRGCMRLVLANNSLIARMEEMQERMDKPAETR